MEKWEYLFARWKIANLTFNEIVIVTINGLKMPREIDWQIVLRLLGEQGWELVGFGEREISVFIFKRLGSGQTFDVQDFASRL